MSLSSTAFGSDSGCPNSVAMASSISSRIPDDSARLLTQRALPGGFLMAVVEHDDGRLGPLWAHPGVLGAEQMASALVAAELAQMPLLDLLAKDLQAAVADPDSDSWAELNTLSRAEVNQATGMLVAQLEVEPAEAMVRLRAHAFATGRSATAVACDILDRRLRLEAD